MHESFRPGMEVKLISSAGCEITDNGLGLCCIMTPGLSKDIQCHV